jgi:hypothetical protein
VRQAAKQTSFHRATLRHSVKDRRLRAAPTPPMRCPPHQLRRQVPRRRRRPASAHTSPSEPCSRPILASSSTPTSHGVESRYMKYGFVLPCIDPICTNTANTFTCTHKTPKPALRKFLLSARAPWTVKERREHDDVLRLSKNRSRTKLHFSVHRLRSRISFTPYI